MFHIHVSSPGRSPLCDRIPDFPINRKEIASCRSPATCPSRKNSPACSPSPFGVQVAITPTCRLLWWHPELLSPGAAPLRCSQEGFMLRKSLRVEAHELTHP